MIKPRSTTDWLALLALVLFWGSSFALTKISVRELTPQWTVAIRLIVGTLIVYTMMRARGLCLPLSRQSINWFFWLGFIGSVLPFYLIGWGTLHISSGLAGILMATVPLVVIVGAHFTLADEPLTGPKLFGFAIGFSGVVILIGPDFLGDIDGRGLTLWAELAILAAATLYALQSITARKSPRMHPFQKTTGVLGAGAIVAVIAAVFSAPSALGTASGTAIWAAILLGIFPTAGAGILLFYLLDRAGAGFVSLSNYLIPPVAFFIGVITLGEPFYWTAAIGLTVILCGIALSQLGGGRPQTK